MQFSKLLAIAKNLGAVVTGVCSNRNSERIKDLGADFIIEYDKPIISANNIIGERKYDIIYDTVTSPEDPDQKPIYKPQLKENGLYVSINSKKGFDFVKAMLKKSTGPRENMIITKWTTEALNELGTLVTGKQASQMIDREFSLSISDVQEAFQIQKSRRAKGKLVFSIHKE